MPMFSAPLRLHTAKICLAAAAMAIAPCAHAQDADADAQDETQVDDEAQVDDDAQVDENAIVVRGERVRSRDVRAMARDITVGSGSANQPLPRFQRPVCPGVWGLGPDSAQAIIDRIYDNAEAAGIDVNDEPECDANVWVIVVDSPEQTFAQLREDRSYLTRHLSRLQTRIVERQAGSARAWSLVSQRNEQGDVIPDGFETASLSAEARALGLPPPGNQVLSVSRLETGVRSDIELSVVLIQRSMLVDLDTYAVADYATMRLLSYTQPPRREDEVSTVLTLFEPGGAENAPRQLTEFDMAYLQALYRSDEYRPARLAIGGISNLIRNGGVPEQ